MDTVTVAGMTIDSTNLLLSRTEVLGFGLGFLPGVEFLDVFVVDIGLFSVVEEDIGLALELVPSVNMIIYLTWYYSVIHVDMFGRKQ